jgi:hypothetical protein
LTGGTSGGLSRARNMRYTNLSFCFLSFAAQVSTKSRLPKCQLGQS